MKPTKMVKGVLLFPGAGTNCEHPSLVRLDESLQPMPVRRADFPYRKLGRRAPDRAPVLLDAVRAEASDFAAVLNVAPSKLVLGGRSMGGRMCSMAVAGATVGDTSGVTLPVAGLILICYPLHPPGKPENLRTEHLPRLCVPCLFISGTRDAFGTPDELQQWTATIPGPVTHVWAEGKGHDLKGADTLIADAVAAWLSALT